MTLGLVVGHSIFNSLSMTMSSDPFVEARRQLTKEQFIDAVMREPVEGIVDLEPIRNKCQKVVQQQGLVWQCDYIQGGLGNLGNTWVNCMYFGIESGATSIILPPVGKRNDKNLIDNGNAKDTTNLPILYDLNHFIETWKQACPHITVYKSPDEVPNLKGNGGRMLTPHQIPGLEVVRQTVFDFHTWRAKFDEWLETNYAADKLQNMSVEKPVHVGAKGLMFAGHRASMDPRFTHAFTRMFASRNSLRRLGAAAVWDLEQRMGRPVVSDAILFPELYAKTYGLPTAAPLQGTTLDKVAVNTSQVTHLLRNRVTDATKFKWPGYEFQAPSYLREALERNLTSIYLAAGSAESTQRFKAEAEAADLTTYTKEDVLGEEEMTEYNALTWDNKAVVDFQVLLHSSFFAGYGQSTFSQTMVMRRSALPDAGPNQVNPWRPFTDKSFEIWRDNLSSIYCSLHMQTLDRIWP
ncbi:inducible alternative oxidase 2 [Sporothrix bragantina]|uniref:Inducible alternative oxidase 2 n=1 Tax=Sporothrix bragantina TaxID=671064 RepID=A0ABP0BGH7_9PEZI